MTTEVRPCSFSCEIIESFWETRFLFRKRLSKGILICYIQGTLQSCHAYDPIVKVL